jgi:HlyD family secretion protein
VLEGDDRAVKEISNWVGKVELKILKYSKGYEPGDKVITSSYENFGTNEVLLLN